MKWLKDNWFSTLLMSFWFFLFAMILPLLIIIMRDNVIPLYIELWTKALS